MGQVVIFIAMKTCANCKLEKEYSQFTLNKISKVKPVMNLSSSAKQTRNSKLFKSVSSKLLLSDERQKLDIPEETAAAHGRATVLVSRKLSRVTSRRIIDANTDENLELLFRNMISNMERQRKSLTRRQQIAFDNSWRY